MGSGFIIVMFNFSVRKDLLEVVVHLNTGIQMSSRQLSQLCVLKPFLFHRNSKQLIESAIIL